jgi:hypothetical protein
MVVERRENVTHHCASYNFSSIHICAFLILWLREKKITKLWNLLAIIKLSNILSWAKFSLSFLL